MNRPRSPSIRRPQHWPAGVLQIIGPMHIIEEIPDSNKHEIKSLDVRISYQGFPLLPQQRVA